MLPPIRYGNYRRERVPSGYPRSISGVKLIGHRFAKDAYLDESDIPPINASRWLPVLFSTRINNSKWLKIIWGNSEIFAPPDRREGFVFHATDLFHKQGDVPARDSHAALRAVLKIPSQFKLSVVFGCARKLERPSDFEQWSKKDKRLPRPRISRDLSFPCFLRVCGRN